MKHGLMPLDTALIPTDLKSEGTSRYIIGIFDRKHLNGIQVMYKFPNGYGASVIRNIGSYGNRAGLFELAVVRFKDDTHNWQFAFDTPITADVMGWLEPFEVENTLLAIKALTDQSMITTKGDIDV